MHMVTTLLPILARLVRSLAWLFAVGTATLIGYCWVLLTFLPHPGRHCTIMSCGSTDAWGLTYLGWRGAVLTLVELVLVVGASCAARTRSRVFRSIGHLVLILWAALWTANAFYVFADGTFGLVYVMPFFFACTCVRAMLDLAGPSTPAPVVRPVRTAELR